MNIKELKELIKDLPDEMEVVEAYDGECSYGINPVTFSVEDLYQWDEWKLGFGDIRPDKWIKQEWVEPIGKKNLVNLGKVFCVKVDY